ncbi:Pre-rRNA-processing protein fhl1 [Dissophora globulifera]|nr:Pre-rRNA-processing protein fhl1 [Dissophora globulifera]
MDESAGSSTYPQATNSNSAAVTLGDTSSEPVQAYAKLEGDSFCYYIRTLQVTFGRKASSSDHVDIHLGPTKAISRQHARLFYNFSTQRFEMMVFGKNGAFVNDQFIEKGVTVPLENRTKIQIGEVSFSFLLPKIETDDSAQETDHGQGPSQRNSGSGSSGSNNRQYDGASSASSIGVKREASSQAIERFDSSEYSSKDTKPPFSYASLIAQAINSTADRKLTLNGIYQHITQHYPYYQMVHNGWQNSIRHNLSLNKAFVKVPRSDSEPGKGAFWTIDQSCEAQFANGVYKRSRRVTSTKPSDARSESPMDMGEKPRKRPNTGTESTLALSQPTTASSSSSTSPTAQGTAALGPKPLTTATQVAGGGQPTPDYSQVSEASLKLAALLQQNPGVLALNLATITQSLSAANKEGAQSAILNAILAAARANSVNTAARAQTTSAAGAGAGGTALLTQTPAITQQSLTTLQAVAAALSAARGVAGTSSATTSNPSTLPTTTAGSTPTSTAAASPIVAGSSIGSPGMAATPAANSSPIAQLVAAAQAQAAAQARALAQAQAQVAMSTSIDSIVNSAATTTPTMAAAASAVENTQAQVLALQARALAIAQEQRAQEAQEAAAVQAVATMTATPTPTASAAVSPVLATTATATTAATALPHTPDTSAGADLEDVPASSTFISPSSSLSPKSTAEK